MMARPLYTCYMHLEWPPRLLISLATMSVLLYLLALCVRCLCPSLVLVFCSLNQRVCSVQCLSINYRFILEGWSLHLCDWPLLAGSGTGIATLNICIYWNMTILFASLRCFTIYFPFLDGRCVSLLINAAGLFLDFFNYVLIYFVDLLIFAADFSLCFGDNLIILSN